MRFEGNPMQVTIGLGALKAVAIASGGFTEEERALVAAAALAFDVETDVDALSVPAPEEVAEAIQAQAWRERLVQAMVVTALIDGDPSREEIAVIERYAAALGVDDPRVKNLYDVLEGRLWRVRVDFMRRAPLPRKLLRHAYEREGVTGAYKFFKAMLSGGGDYDAAKAWRSRKLGLLPEGTLGREFWKHMTEREFALPGEHGGLLDAALAHDLTHVMTGYDTDPEGETQIASFYAGFFKEDPFSMIFMVMLMFHLGVKLSPIATPAKMSFDPAKALRAMERGSKLTIDLTDAAWDPWPMMSMPIADARRALGIEED